jgi:hypothetical protein
VQLFGAVFLLFGPQAHAHCRNEEHEQVRKEPVQLIQISQIGRKKTFLPKGSNSAEENE